MPPPNPARTSSRTPSRAPSAASKSMTASMRSWASPTRSRPWASCVSNRRSPSRSPAIPRGAARHSMPPSSALRATSSCTTPSWGTRASPARLSPRTASPSTSTSRKDLGRRTRRRSCRYMSGPTAAALAKGPTACRCMIPPTLSPRARI